MVLFLQHIVVCLLPLRVKAGENNNEAKSFDRIIPSGVQTRRADACDSCLPSFRPCFIPSPGSWQHHTWPVTQTKLSPRHHPPPLPPSPLQALSISQNFPPPDLSPADIATQTDALVCAAAHNGHASTLKWLLETRFTAYNPRLDANLAALHGGPEVYEVFLQKWPHVIDYELRHNGNPIGLAVFRNDARMVRFLLGRGVDPNSARFGNKLVSWLA